MPKISSGAPTHSIKLNHGLYNPRAASMRLYRHEAERDLSGTCYRGGDGNFINTTATVRTARSVRRVRASGISHLFGVVSVRVAFRGAQRG